MSGVSMSWIISDKQATLIYKQYNGYNVNYINYLSPVMSYDSKVCLNFIAGHKTNPWGYITILQMLHNLICQ